MLTQVVNKKNKRKLDNLKRKEILKALIYEKRYGKPIYYKNYEKVLKGKLPLEAVMGSSLLYALILYLIYSYLIQNLSKDYIPLAGEVGFKFVKGSWYNIDLGIWEKEKITLELFEDKLTAVPPKIAIEIDTKADVKKFGSFEEYVNIKTQDLLEHGVEKVIWIFTKSKKILVAEKDKDWIITNWNKEIILFENLKINLEKLLKEMKK